MKSFLLFIGFCVLAACAPSAIKSNLPKNCATKVFESKKFTYCQFAPNSEKIALYLKNKDDEIIGDFDALMAQLSRDNKKLLFAMNAGMYHEDRRPVGLYVENGHKIGRLQKRASNDNFGLLPNGVFWLDGTEADVSETLAFEKRFDKQTLPKYVTQSGPMLVIDGKLHKTFKSDSQSLNIRNGVGIDKDKKTLYFVISDERVNFHTFARFFRDELKTPNALYLDGSISRLYAFELNRNDQGAMLGPMIGIIE